MSAHSIMGPELTEEVLVCMFRAGGSPTARTVSSDLMRGIMAGPTLLNVRHSPAGPSRLAGIAFAGSLPPPLRPLPAVLPADQSKAAWAVRLHRVHRSAGYPRYKKPAIDSRSEEHSSELQP